MPEKKPRRKATLPLSQTQAAMDTEYRERKVQEAESDTIACLGRGDISILSALTTQLPDVFYGEILPKTDMWDKLSLAQVSKTYRDTVWSVDGVRSMKPNALVIQMAARHGNLPAVRALLQSGVNPDEYLVGREAGNKQICTALHMAAGRGHVGVAKALIEAGADVNKQETLDDLGKTPLMLAAAAGHTPVIMELIRAGANVNSAKNFAGANVNTALEEAVLNAHEACVLALIHAGADVHMDGFGESIMQENTATYAEDAGAYRNIVGLLRYAASRNFLVLELDSA